MKQEALDDILKLSVPERLEIAEAIWNSVAAAPENLPVTEAQKRELDRRYEAYKEDPDRGRSWDEVRESLRNRR